MLRELTTNQKGLIVRVAVELGIGVARPLDDERYDLILDTGPELLRVQCKWAEQPASRDQLGERLRVQR